MEEIQQPSSRTVHERQYRDRKKERNVEGHRDNFADQVRHLENLQSKNDPFVRSVHRADGRTPYITLVTDEQIADIKNMCCTGKTVFGVDKTFNLCNMHVTVTCYKQLSVTSYRTGEPPIFLGPMFIHDSSDTPSFANFFFQIRIKLGLDVDLDKLVIGTDDEKAMVNGLRMAFPQATHVLCTRHLEENARHMLTNDAITVTQKQRVLKRIFGDGGLVNANDSICYDDMAEKIEVELSDISDKFTKYYKKRLVGTLKLKVNDPQRRDMISKNWTNNNCESINHVLKQAVGWKPHPLPDLVEVLRDLVNGQFRKLRGALLQSGDYRLSQTHKRFELTKTDWIKLTPDQKTNHFRRFRSFVPSDGKMVTSTDGKTTVLAPKTNGRKPGQVKRKPKTLTITNKRAKTDM